MIGQKLFYSPLLNNSLGGPSQLMLSAFSFGYAMLHTTKLYLTGIGKLWHCHASQELLSAQQTAVGHCISILTFDQTLGHIIQFTVPALACLHVYVMLPNSLKAAFNKLPIRLTKPARPDIAKD